VKTLEKYKLVILAGGYGTRLGRFTKIKPKPMVDVGGIPLIIHIINIYKKYGVKKFIICLGFKGEIIKNYFLKNFKKFKITTKKNITILKSEDIEFYLLNTGIKTMTGGRIRKIKKLVKDEKFFYLTYGDGLANINIKKLTNFHLKQKKIATVTVVKIQIPQERFGVVYFKKKNIVKSFLEKPNIKKIYINGGFFILSPKVINYIKSDNSRWETVPLQNIAKKKELSAYKHNGFWKCMDTPRDKKILDDLCKKDKAPWI
jgi:glucose-1-phosphate cytidylyltransferase|tara:strand:+ start:74 stop:850 length:777 start_codon:yes stop_codon:yes gene_type:complete